MQMRVQEKSLLWSRWYEKYFSWSFHILAVAVMTAVLLSLILGFMLGVKFYGQVVNRCTLSSRNSDSFDGPKNRTIKGVKYPRVWGSV